MRPFPFKDFSSLYYAFICVRHKEKKNAINLFVTRQMYVFWQEDDSAS